jgi:hypothetical protein
LSWASRRCEEKAQKITRPEHLASRDKISNYSNEQVRHIAPVRQNFRSAIDERGKGDSRSYHPLHFPFSGKFLSPCLVVRLERIVRVVGLQRCERIGDMLCEELATA